MASSGEPHWDAPGSHIALRGPPLRLASTCATYSHESAHPAGDWEQISREFLEAGSRGEEWWCQVTETSLPGPVRAATPRSPSVVGSGSVRPRARRGSLRCSAYQAPRGDGLPASVRRRGSCALVPTPGTPARGALVLAHRQPLDPRRATRLHPGPVDGGSPLCGKKEVASPGRREGVSGVGNSTRGVPHVELVEESSVARKCALRAAEWSFEPERPVIRGVPAQRPRLPGRNKEPELRPSGRSPPLGLRSETTPRSQGVRGAPRRSGCCERPATGGQG